MIDNLFDVLYVAKTGKIKPDASLTDNLYGKKFYDAHSGIITTATGNPVSIITNKAQNAISTLLSYSPKQSGSGDPSPQNIRPITGWTDAVLHVNEDTTTISLGGTYYGFSVDVERGVLKLLWYADDLGSFTWRASSVGDGRFFCTATSHRYENPSSIICSIYKNDGRGTQAVGYYGENGTFRYWEGSSITEFYVRDTRFPNVSDLPDFVQAITGQKVCYELYTPIELPLTTQTVALLAGNNTIWTDGDSLSVTYKAKKA